MMKSSDKYNQLKTTSLFVLLPMFLLFIACGKTEIMQEMKETTNIKSYVSKGDTMLYGLACDGCSDSVLVFLPDSGGDPINYSILEARLNHQVFGRPRIGDRMAVLVDTANPKALMLAINMEQVNGTWYYEEMPQPRHRTAVPSSNTNEGEQQMREEDRQRRDSFIQTFMVPREYSYTFKRDQTVNTQGGPPRTSSLDRNSPVEYPPIKRYSEWHLCNGKIIFTYSTFPVPGNTDSTLLVNDTAEFVMLRRDTMALRFNDHVQGFKLKPDSVKNQ